MRRKFVVASYALATLLLAIVLVSTSQRVSKAKAEGVEAHAVAANAAKNASVECCGGDEGHNKPHLLAGTYYTLKDNFTAKLLLNNKGPRPIEVRATLFSLSGERFEAPVEVVEPTSHRFINLNDWVTAAGEQFREGSLQIFHRGKDLVLGTQIYLNDNAHSLGFEEKLIEPATAASSRLEGVWWLPSPKGAVSLALSNTTDASVSVATKIRGASPKREADETVVLQPHETKVLDIERDLLRKGRGAMSSYGAVSVEHNGARGAVVARAMAQDASNGYSLPVQFIDPKGGKSTNLQGAGLRIGKARKERLSAKVVAYNAGESETTLSGRIPYTTNDGSMGEITLPQVQLLPGETKLIDLSPSVNAHGVQDKVATAGLEFEYTGAPGSLVTSAFSVSQNNNQVFRVPLWDIAAQRSATGGYPWYIDGDSSTFVYIKNVTSEPRQYALQLSHEEGVYSMGVKTVPPHQTVALDIRDLRDRAVPDEMGRMMPPEAARGQVLWSLRGNQNQVLIGLSEQADIARGTSSNYACMNCCPDSFSNGWVDPGGIDGLVGLTNQFTSFEQYSNCYGYVYEPNIAWASWDSNNYYVMSCYGDGVVMTENPGEAWAGASWSTYIWRGDSGNPNECVPYSQNVFSNALFNVLQNLRNRGRIQAQGRNPPVEVSRAWAQDTIPDRDEGLDWLDQVWNQLTPRQQADRRQAYLDCRQYILDCPSVGCPRVSKRFQDPARRDPSARIDLEIITGLAFQD
jgi:hypothetical protein